MPQTPSPGTRWVRRGGKHDGNEVEIDHTSDISTFFVAIGGGDAWGNQKSDDSKVNRVTTEQFMRQYMPRDSLEPSGTGGGRAFRQHNPRKPKVSQEAPELSLNGIDLVGARGLPLSVEILEISPSMARAWLDRGGDNRVPTRSRVDRLANAIRRGEWRLTGDSIKLDSDGRVRDGRHRLLAVVAAGMPIRSLVVRGVDEDAFTVFDTGKSRTPADVMGIAGYQNRVAIASVARGLILIEASGRYDPSTRKDLDPLLSHTALLRYVKEHPDVEQGVLLANHVRAGGLSGGAGLLGLLFVLLLRADAEAVQVFADALRSGANLEVDSPILRLRNRLITDRRMPNGLADREHLLALGIKAWNFWRAGEKVGQLTWHAQRGTGTRSGEAFPVAI